MAETTAEEEESLVLKETSCLTINIDSYLKLQGVEKQRMEFKESWNNSHTKFQVVRTISAFVNDFYNDYGGYIVIGVEEDESEEATTQVKLPPVGIKPTELDKIQKEIIGACIAHIKPPYTPILDPQLVEGKMVLGIEVRPSTDRPHKAQESAKGKFSYYIRKASMTTKATHQEEQGLLERSADIPFDDRKASNHGSGKRIGCHAIKKRLVRQYLDDINSKLDRNLSHVQVVTKLMLIVRDGEVVDGDRCLPIYVPKNVALLMFNLQPEFYFPGAKIEITQFSRDKEILHEKTLTGPLDKQTKQCIEFILSTTNKEKSVSALNYPKRALREAVVNAVYHRGYEPKYDSPTKVYIRPHCLEICSYPGPDPSLKMEHFLSGKDIPPSPARNRRIGEFLKDLKLAEARGTGVNTIFKTMKSNKNPDPQFEFDTFYFQVTLPAHPKFKAAILLKEVEEYETKGDLTAASKVIEEAFDKNPQDITQSLIQKLISLHGGRFDHPTVMKYAPHILENTRKRSALIMDLEEWRHRPNARNEITTGVSLIQSLVKVDADIHDLEEVTEMAIKMSKERDAETRLQCNQKAHMLLEAYGEDLLSSKVTIAYHFGVVKYNIYTQSKKKRRRSTEAKATGLLKEAEDWIHYAIVINERNEIEPRQLASQYRQLGYILHELFKAGKGTALSCVEWYNKARALDPKINIPSFMQPRDSTLPHRRTKSPKTKAV